MSIACFGEPKEPLSPTRQRGLNRLPDPIVTAKLFQLDGLVLKAEESGDQATAKSLRQALAHVRKLEAEIDALEAEKKEAVKLEDYETARSLKAKIEGIRISVMEDSSPRGLGQNVMTNISSIIGVDAKGSVLPNFGLPVPDALPPADPLPEYFARDYPHVLESLGEATVALLLSRDWRLREKGVENVISRLKKSDEFDVSSLSWVAKKLTAEKIVGLSIKLCDLIQVICTLGPQANESLAETVEFTAIFLIEHKLTDSNKRLSDAVILTMVKVAESSSQYAHLVYQYLLKGILGPKSIAARCLCLLSILQSVGLKGKRAVNLEALITTLAEWYPKTTSGETKLALMQLLAEIVRLAGEDEVDLTIRSTCSGHLRDSLLFELSRLPIRAVLSPSGGTELAVACEFCGKKDRKFSLEENMDMHYWSECPALIECAYCEQVVELLGLTEHRLKECESRDAALIE